MKNSNEKLKLKKLKDEYPKLSLFKIYILFCKCDEKSQGL
jgi:hypothetical protein